MTRDITLVPPAAGLRLILARHGQTPSNVHRILDTRPPGPALTGTGRVQADQLADRFAREKLTAVYASEAVRAQQTAAPLARRHQLDVEVVRGVHEVFVGDLEGSQEHGSRDVFDRIYADWHHGRLDVPMPGGESGRDALTRFMAAVQPLVDSASDGSITLVSHGAMLRLAAIQLVADVDPEQAYVARLPNAGAIVLESDLDAATGWRCAQWDGLYGGDDVPGLA